MHEANAIAYYVSNDQLRGTSLEDCARVLQWLTYGSTDVASAVASWVYPALSLVESTPQLVQRAQEDLKTVFHCLNEHLKTRTYLVGERLTLADISLAADLLLAYEHVADEAFRQPFANVNRWYLTVANQTHFKKANGEVKLAVKAPEFCATRHAEHKKQAAAASVAKPKVEKPKAEKPKPAPKAKVVEEPEEEDESAEPKQNDPFAEMPKG